MIGLSWAARIEIRFAIAISMIILTITQILNGAHLHLFLITNTFQHLIIENGPLSHELVVDGMNPALVCHPHLFLHHILHSLCRSGTKIFLSKKAIFNINHDAT